MWRVACPTSDMRAQQTWDPHDIRKAVVAKQAKHLNFAAYTAGLTFADTKQREAKISFELRAGPKAFPVGATLPQSCGL